MLVGSCVGLSRGSVRVAICSVLGGPTESGGCVVFGISLLFVMMTPPEVCVKVSSVSVDYC